MTNAADEDPGRPGRRAARSVKRPDLPPSALKTLKDALFDLYLRAGRPTMADLARDVREHADGLDLPGAPSKDTIHRILTSAKLPAESGDAVALAAVLARQLNLDTAAVCEQVAALWEAAAARAPAAWTAAGPEDPRGHFVSRAQGYRGWVSGADRFRGRASALAAVRSWIVRPRSPKILVITGQPGAGKSAVLARVVLALEDEGALRGVMVHARNATTRQIVSAVAAAAGLPENSPSSEILQWLSAADQKTAAPLIVAIDALDEMPAFAERRETAEFLRDLAKTPRMRVVLATRALSAGDRYAEGNLLPILGVPGVSSENLIDLDENRYFDRRDLESFVEIVLLAGDEEGVSPYAGRPNLVARLARTVAGRADGNFLVAALTATGLAGRPDVVDPSDPDYESGQIPTTVGEAIDKYLDYLAEDRRVLTRAMLTALAYARGGGIGDERWVRFCRVLGYPVSHLEIDMLRDSAVADYLLETTTAHGETATRLFHQALVDELLRLRKGRRAHDELALLRTLVPASAGYWRDAGASPAGSPPDWRSCDSYIRLTLPEHAKSAGVLDTMMADPGFLLTCGAEQLLQFRESVSAAESVTAMEILSLASLDWLHRPGVDKRWRLYVWAKREGAAALARSLEMLQPRWPWRVHAVFQNGLGNESPLGVGSFLSVTSSSDRNETEWIVAGGDDGRIYSWPLDGDGVESTSPDGHQGWVFALAEVHTADGRRLIASGGGGDAAIRLWDLDAEALVGRPLEGHTDRILAVAPLSAADDRSLIASGGDDGTIRVWDVIAGREISRLPAVEGASVLAVTHLPQPGGPDLAVGGYSDGVIRAWNVQTRTMAGPEIIADAGRVLALSTMPATHARRLLVSGGDDGLVRVWDPRTGRAVGRSMAGHSGRVWSVAALPAGEGKTLIFSGGDDGTVRVWDFHTRDQIGEAMHGHAGRVWSVTAMKDRLGRPALVSCGDDKLVVAYVSAVEPARS